MSRCSLTGVASLLLASGLFAGHAHVRTVTAVRDARASSGLPGITVSKDVGILTLYPAPSCDLYIALDDTVFPRCLIRNNGSQAETNIPVICVVYDTAAGARVYGPETVYVANLDPGVAETVELPAWLPPTEEKVYIDTMAVALPGDEKPENDRRPGRITVLDWGSGRLSYNDGSFENCFSWVTAGSEFAERFITSERPLQIDKVVLWLASLSGTDYDAEVRAYGNDGTPYGEPGTQLGAWVGKLHSDKLPFRFRNEVFFDPPVAVAYDTFFVSYYQTSVAPAYPWLGVDETAPIELGNDWGRNRDDNKWGVWTFDYSMDFGIDVYVGPAGLASEGAPGRRTSVVITPNPASRRATARYSLPTSVSVAFDVYDVTGRAVLTRTIAAERAGTANLDLRTLKAGVYLVRVRADGFSATQKLVVEH